MAGGVEGAGHGPRRVALLLFLLALGLLSLVLLRAYKAAQEAAIVAEVPLLRADAGPIRRRPEDPGGMTVPHREMLVYEAIEGGTVEHVVERLLPPPEEPLPRPSPPEPVITPALDAAPPAPEPPVAPAAEPSPELAAAPPPPPAPEPAAEAVDPIETALSLAADGPDDPNVGFRVQLGAFRSAEEAAAGWLSASSKAPELLAPIRHFVARKDLDDGRGVFHRLHVGPLPSRESAASLCNQLKAAGVDCFVVAP
jgi:cell division septation protein DedD